MLSNANSEGVVEQLSLLESMETHQKGHGTRLCMSVPCVVTVSDKFPYP